VVVVYAQILGAPAYGASFLVEEIVKLLVRETILGTRGVLPGQLAVPLAKHATRYWWLFTTVHSA
jgi:hypothetical protein